MIRCGKCKKTFDENKIADICPYCGNENNLEILEESNVSEQESKVSEKESMKSDNDSKVASSTIVVVIFILLALFSISRTGKEEPKERTPQEMIQFIIEVERRKNK